MGDPAKGSDRIIVNPETLEDLKHQGIPFDTIPSQTNPPQAPTRNGDAGVLGTHPKFLRTDTFDESMREGRWLRWRFYQSY